MSTLAELEALIKGRRCRTCHEVPTVAWRSEPWEPDGGYHALRCACHPYMPILERKPGRAESRVLGGRYPQPVDKQAMKELFT